MTAKIINIGELSIQRKGEKNGWTLEKPKCYHRRVIVDSQGHIVTCQDCNLQIQPFWALLMLMDYYESEVKNVEYQKRCLLQERETLKNENIHLIAARKLEKLWRGRRSLPGCPHCSRGITPEDITEDRSRHVSREMEMARRAKK